MPTPELEALRKQLHEAIDLAISDYDLKIERNFKECLTELDKACKQLPAKEKAALHTQSQIRSEIAFNIGELWLSIKQPVFTLSAIAHELSKYVDLLEGDYQENERGRLRWNSQVSGALRSWCAADGPVCIQVDSRNRYRFTDFAVQRGMELEADYLRA